MRIVLYILSVIIFFAIFCATNLIAQTYLHPTTGVQGTYNGACMENTCSGTYYDNGGAGGNYSNNINLIYWTFCPDVPGNCLQANFTAFDVEFQAACNFDILNINNGPTQNSPTIWSGCGTTGPGIITSTDSSGCLTFRFKSDAFVSRPGWTALLSCVPCSQGPTGTDDNDCINADVVCGNGAIISASTGPGIIGDGCAGCQISENFSNWYSFTVGTSGNLTLTITPTVGTDDYDFVLYGPNVTCGSLGIPVRCSYASNIGNTGMNLVATDNSEDVTGDGWLNDISVTAGQTYYLMINKWSNGGSGFTLTWGGSAILGTSTGNVVITSTNSCSGTCNGTATAIVTSGNPPYTYSWSTGATTQSITSLCAGTYTVNVTDGTACTANASTVITTLPPILITIFGRDRSCSIADGFAGVEATGGTPPFSYSWSNGAATQMINGLAAGTYTATAIDAAGCRTTSSVIISTNTSPVVSAGPDANICQGSSTVLGGSVTYTETVGPTFYNFTDFNIPDNIFTAGYNPAFGINSTISVSGLCATTLSADMIESVCLNIEHPFDADLDIYLACPDGTWIILSTDNGAGGDNYTGTCFTPTAVTSITAGAPPFTGNFLPEGSFTAFSGCTSNGTWSLNIQDDALADIGTLLNWSIKFRQDTCISWTPTTALSNPTILNPVATPASTTTYTLTVSDNLACSSSDAATITVSPSMILSIVSTNITCNGLCNGTADLSVSGGTAPYTYRWTNGAITQDISGLCAGTYTVTVRDIFSCQSISSVIITEPAALTASIIGTNITCVGLCNGSADLTPGGGTGAYTYNWSNGITTQDQLGTLCAGTYTATVRDANGCLTTASVIITAPPLLTASITSTNVACVGNCNGSADLTPVGGIGAYTYNWSNGITTQDQLGTLCAGTYTATVRDANGCLTTASVTITTPPALTASIISTNVTCAGSCNGSADLTPGGGTGSYTYSWSNGITTQDQLGTLCVGTYTATVRDANGCLTTASVTITAPPALTASITSTNVTCTGSCNGIADLTPGGGTGAYTFSWSNGITTEDQLGTLCAGTYTATVRDANSCLTTASVIITAPPLLTASITSTDVTCAGSCNGSADLTPGGGTGAYTYNWSNGITTQDQLGTLCAGTYTATVRDANGCLTTASVTITVPPALTASISSTNVTCAGSCNGSADLTPGGGTGAYTYSWSNGITTQDQLGTLCAGTYTATVRDANGCLTTASVTITAPPALTASISSTNVTCAGSCNGSADLTPGGGTGAYTYSWSNGITTQDQLGTLCAGTYTATVRDANGCLTTAVVTIIEPAILSASIVSTNVTCFAICDGSADLTPSGGTGAYTYSWSNGITTQDQLGTLCVGAYTATVRDANGCLTTASVTITQPSVLTASITSTNLTCNGQCTGSADLTPGGGTGAFTYSWSNGITTQDQLGTLCAGTYTATVRDANGCLTTASITITGPTAIVLTTGKTDATCGNPDGSASVTATGGTPAYTYSWTTGSTGASITGVIASSYIVTVRDANNCQSLATVNINDIGGPSAGISTSTNVNCNGGSNGAATVTASGGVLPYTYKWSNGATTASIGGLTAATYTVTVSDANNCKSIANAIITEPSVLTATITSTNVTCTGLCNGSADLTPGGGTGAYTYSWSNGITTQDQTGTLCPGTYTATVRDANSCLTTASVTITEPSALIATITSTNTTCFGSCNGSADLTPGGGTGAYTYIWSNGITTEDQSGTLCAGTYTATVRDANGCLTTASVTITAPTALTASISSTNVTCAGSCNGSADLTPGGGTGAFTYSWSNGITTEDQSGTLCVGTYTATVRDANGCLTTASVTITAPTALTASISSTNVTCAGSCNGSADLTPGGGTGAFTYSWSNGITTEDQLGTLCLGTYTATVRDANGCLTTASVTITAPTALTASISSTNVTCAGSCNGSADLTPGGGTGAFTYSWSNGITTEDQLGSLCVGTYTATVRDANGCLTTASVIITAPPALTASITSTNVTCTGSCNGSADLTPGGGTGAYTYSWSNGIITEDQLGSLCAGTYTATVRDANGCLTTASVTITAPLSLTASISSTNITCFGLCNGSADLTPSGGTGAYTYSWSNGITTEDQSGSLCPGTYIATVRDANGCLTTTSVTIIEPPILISSITSTNVTCFGLCNGSADLTPGGGTGAYTYTWSNGVTTQDQLGILCAGNYTATVRDANGCLTTASVTITEPSALTASAASTNATCNGVCDGSIDLTVTGGTPSYTYTWSNGVTTQDLSSLCTGTYSVTIRDANGCVANADVVPVSCFEIESILIDVCTSGNEGEQEMVRFQVGASPLNTSTLTVAWPFNSWLGVCADPAIVTQINSSITGGGYVLQPSGGVLPAGANVILITSTAYDSSYASFANLKDTVYLIFQCSGNLLGHFANYLSGGGPRTLSMTFGGGCSDTVTYMRDSLVLKNGSLGAENGASVNFAINGTAKYFNNGCVAPVDTFPDKIVITITQPPALTASIAGTNVTCLGVCNGSADLTPGGGTGAYTYSWSNGITTQDQLGSLCAGTYTATVRDANGCLTTASVTLTAPVAITASIISTNVTCFGLCNGVADLTPSGGTPPYTYVWTNGFTTQDLGGLCPSTLTVTVKDVNSCQTTATVTITEPSLLTASIISTNETCNGLCNGIADLTPSGGTIPYTYLWTSGAITQDLTGLCPGSYTVTVRDVNNCQAIASLTITGPSLLTSSLIGTNAACNGLCNGAADLTPLGGSIPYTYSWSNLATTQDLSGLCAGVYTATVKDANNCQTTSSITVTQPPVLVASAGNDTSICTNDSVTIGGVPTASGGAGGYSYAWSPASGLSSVTVSNPKASPSSTTIYTVVVTDVNLCTATDNMILSFNPKPIPNAGPDTTICEGIPVTLSASGGGTYSWSPGGATTSSITVSPTSTTNYIVTVTAVNACINFDTAKVTVNPLPVASIIGTNVLCNAACNGSADLTPSGGTLPYSYSWTNSATTQDISVLCAGTYTVTLRDSKSCTDIESIVISQPTDITITTNKTDATCGASNGTATATATGGTPGYTYKWNTGATTQSISVLIAATYTVTVTDANSCIKIANVTVNNVGGPTVTITNIVNVSCNGGSNGSAAATATGGTAPYTYSWNTIPVQTSATATALSAGTFIIEVTDNIGCLNSTTATITQPSVLGLTMGKTDVSCTGGSNGTANVLVSGGTPAYTYVWTTGAITSSISGLGTGTYTVTVRDVNNCMTTGSVTITEVTALGGTIVATNAPCNSACNGAADLTSTGGTVPYTYSWTNSATTQDVTGLCVGTYTVTVKDVNSCQTNISLTITEPPALSATILGTNVTCNSVCDGSVDLTPSGGTGAYTYSWTNGATSQDIGSLCAATYTVTVKDANNCQTLQSIAITQPSLLTLSTSKTDVTCNGGTNGIAGVVAAGGTPLYTYNWSNGGTTSTISSIPAGTYTITVTDSKGCKTIAIETVNQPSAISIFTTTGDANCGQADGKASVSASGGTPGYTYNWSNGVITFNNLGIVAGSYTVTVRDANSCISITSVVVNNISGPTVVMTDSTGVSCNGGNDGSAKASAYLGTAPYSYNWSEGSTGTSIVASAGTYTVTVTDANACKATATVTINQPIALAISFGKTDVTCNGGNDGTASATVSGGTVPYTYSWSTGSTSANIISLAGGVYTVTVIDAKNCNTIGSVTITEPSLLVLLTAKTDVSCNGGNNGTATATAIGGTPSYTYKWSNGATSQSITSLTAGDYTITVTDSKGCKANTSLTIKQPSIIIISTGNKDVSCNGGSDGIAYSTASGGTPGYSYLWSAGGSDSTKSGITAGTYTVTVTDANGCKLTSSVTINQPLAITITTTNKTDAACGLSNGSVRVSASGGTSGYSYLWSNGQTDSSVTALAGGNYAVTVTDSKGCKQKSNIVINNTGSASVGIFSIINVSCNGGSNGSATTTASGGTKPYTYLWIPSGGTDSIATALSAGSYTLQVTDNIGCVSSVIAAISQPSSVSLSAFNTDVSCNAGNNGAARVSASGGTPAYTYSWLSGGTDSIKTALSSGTYTVTVKDANACIAITSVTINQPAAFVLTMSKTDVSCKSGSDGTANVIATGGTGAYTYAWTTGGTSSTIISLIAGTYTITVKDANNCSSNNSITVNEPTLLAGVMNDSTSVSCNGGNDGKATTSAFGGTAAYTYLWNTSPVQTSTNATGLTAGTHYVTIIDSKGCKDTVSVLVSAPTSLVALIADSSNASCNGGNDGTARVTAYGGTKPFTYSWTNGQTDSVVTGLSAGILYTVNISDSKGCSTSASITLAQPFNLILSKSITNPLCNGGSDGLINLTVTGGTVPYTYNWSTGAVTEDLSALTAGVYIVTVKDANNCFTKDSITINNPAPVELKTEFIDVKCNGGSDGVAIVTISGGTPGYALNWSNGKISNFSSSGSADSIGNLTIGSYNVSVTDANLCPATAAIIINEPSAIELYLDSKPAKCNAGNDGEASVSVAGGIVPYSYMWFNGTTNSIATGLTAGQKIVSITDANNCLVIDSIAVSQPLALNLKITTSDASCNGYNDGSVTVSVTGGILPYSLIWSNGSTDSIVTALSAGVYILTITDVNLCKAIQNITINEPLPLTVNFNSIPLSCNGGNDGSATAIPAGGTLPYTYSWSTTPFQTGSSATGLTVGSYTVTVTDTNKCVVVGNIVVTEPSALTLTMTSIGIGCDGTPGTASVQSLGGTAPYTYKWSSGGNDSVEVQLSAGTYTVSVIDDNLCKTAGSVVVDPQVLVFAGPDNQDFCKTTGISGFVDTSSVSPKGGTWSAVDTIVALNLKPNGYLDHVMIPWGTYDIIYTFNGCSDTIPIIITGAIIPVSDTTYCASEGKFVLPKATPAGGIWSGTGIINVNTGEVNPSGLAGQTLPYFYTSNNCPDTIFVNYDKDLPIPQLKCGEPNKAGATFEWQVVSDADEYQVSYDSINWFTPNSGPTGLTHDTMNIPASTKIKLYIRIINGSTCSPGDAASIECESSKFEIPNVTTPNDDGVNDNFAIKGLLPKSSLTIYNRWGQMVFHQDDYKNNWDGGVLMPDVYYYILIHADGKNYHGWVRIIR